MSLPSSPPVGLLHKDVGVSGVKVLDDQSGIVEAFVAGIGNKDSVGDIIQLGAFVDSLKARTPKGVWSHNWDMPVSKTLEIYEVAPGDPRLPTKMQTAGIGGLYVKTQFNLKTTTGRDAYENVKFFGDEAEWSIGYTVDEGEFSKDLQANLLHKIGLYEYSPVLFGANPLTSTVSIKVAGGGEIRVAGIEDADVQSKISAAVKSILTEGETKNDAEPAAGGAVGTEATPVESEGSKPQEKTLPAEAPVERKTVPGSFEERERRLYDALQGLYDGCYAWVRATFDSNVIYTVERNYFAEAIEDALDSGADDETEDAKVGTWAVSYAIADDGTVTFGTPVAVELVEVVVAKYAMADAIAKGHVAKLSDMTKALDVGEITEKAGRVLSKTNRDKILAAKDALDAVLEADNKDEEGAKSGEPNAIPVVEPAVKDDTHPSGISDEAWNGGAQWKNLPGEEVVLKAATAWATPDGEVDSKSSYRFIHHFVDEEGLVGDASLKACLTGLKVLANTNTSTDLTTEDRIAVYKHLSEHIQAANVEDENVKSAMEALEKELGICCEDCGEKAGAVKATAQYAVRKDGDKYCVYDTDTDKNVSDGCFDNRPDAVEHMRGLGEDKGGSDKSIDEAPASGEEALPVDVTLDEDALPTGAKDGQEAIPAVEADPVSPETPEVVDPDAVHEFKLMDGSEDGIGPCDICGEVSDSGIHAEKSEMVTIDVTELAAIEVLLAEMALA